MRRNRQLMWRPPRVLLVWFLFLGTMVQAGETNNSLATKPKEAIRHSTTNAQKLAAEHERAGRKSEAAALYEKVAHTNTAARRVLSHRLVALYTETGETTKALVWANEVMRDNPDPQAYLAAVHARLGQAREARGILEREIAANTNATRAVTLRWQLADAFESSGDRFKAHKILSDAASIAKGTAMEPAARRRLNGLNQPAK